MRNEPGWPCYLHIKMELYNVHKSSFVSPDVVITRNGECNSNLYAGVILHVNWTFMCYSVGSRVFVWVVYLHVNCRNQVMLAMRISYSQEHFRKLFNTIKHHHGIIYLLTYLHTVFVGKQNIFYLQETCALPNLLIIHRKYWHEAVRVFFVLNILKWLANFYLYLYQPHLSLFMTYTFVWLYMSVYVNVRS